MVRTEALRCWGGGERAAALVLRDAAAKESAMLRWCLAMLRQEGVRCAMVRTEALRCCGGGERDAALVPCDAAAGGCATDCTEALRCCGGGDVYADTVLPEERAAVSLLLAQEVAGG